MSYSRESKSLGMYLNYLCRKLLFLAHSTRQAIILSDTISPTFLAEITVLVVAADSALVGVTQ